LLTDPTRGSVHTDADATVDNLVTEKTPRHYDYSHLVQTTRCGILADDTHPLALNPDRESRCTLPEQNPPTFHILCQLPVPHPGARFSRITPLNTQTGGMPMHGENPVHGRISADSEREEKSLRHREVRFPVELSGSDSRRDFSRQDVTGHIFGPGCWPQVLQDQQSSAHRPPGIRRNVLRRSCYRLSSLPRRSDVGEVPHSRGNSASSPCEICSDGENGTGWLKARILADTTTGISTSLTKVTWSWPDEFARQRSAKSFEAFWKRGSSAKSTLTIYLLAPTTCLNTLRLLRSLQIPSRAILLEGSPGVGKTSIVAALAKATGHQVFVEPLSKEDLLVIVKGSHPTLDSGLAEKMIQLTYELNGKAKTENWAGGPWEWNLRDLSFWIKSFDALDGRQIPGAFVKTIYADRLRRSSERQSVGDSYCGKSSVVKTLAQLVGKKVYSIPVSSAMDTTELLGGFEQVLMYSSGRHTLGQAVVSIKRKIDHLFRVVDDFLENCSVVCREDKDRLDGVKKELIDLNDCVDKQGALAGGNFEWVDSILVKCLQEGNWLVVDNVNLCSGAVLDRLNGLLEPDGVLVLGERGVGPDSEEVVIRPHEDFRIIFTMDPARGNISRWVIIFDKCSQLTK
ncbi:unnamed protein product, partial [Nesidiocoris tenuis]